jgi:hypothetical protein
MNNKILEEKVKYVVHSLVYEKGFVCSVDLLLRLGYLSQSDYATHLIDRKRIDELKN